MTKAFKTPVAKKKESFADYDLSPPKVKGPRSFDETIAAIQQDWKGSVKIERRGNETVWTKILPDGTKQNIPLDLQRLLLFLYSRGGFQRYGTSQHIRKDRIRQMLTSNPKRIREAFLQLIAIDGDQCLASQETYQNHYRRTCLTIHRYFQQDQARGFVPDMSSLTFYLRMQKKQGSCCFLQAPCVAMSYIIQTKGKDAPPANASRLVRHFFTDEQLYKFIVDDSGGDSVAVLQILEEKFFKRPEQELGPVAICCGNMKGRKKEIWLQTVKLYLAQGPALVSKFAVPHKFKCSPPSDDLKKEWPQIAEYSDWNNIPAGLIPPGAARFAVWDEPAEFVPLRQPTEMELLQKENRLRNKWDNLLLQSSNEDSADNTIDIAGTASMSTDLEQDGSQTPHGERSSPRDRRESTFVDPGCIVEDWSHFLNDDDEDEDVGSQSETFSEDLAPREGSGDAPPLHAMVLLGCRVVDGSDYWLLQNSWGGPCQIIEVSTEYLVKSNAFLYFWDIEDRELKEKIEWGHSLECKSPVAECSQFDRDDCETWPDYLVHSEQEKPQQATFDEGIDFEF
eukprot:CAMPEP_0168734640 /NCGR_PEP_ID=MMETSP0724-20121128/8918_1 /TAXON_ID=265536 /ORGANISM="Amphiprora sp., Strain CCMP467" /LENGTH=564 /DNA_ID=CAMNT_0008781751 /DNA_START=161 /DNA_END=1855 /DNA_ORIENTATION=+